jgi:uncharacterized protein (DUF488 family)
MELFTIGFTRKTAEQFFDSLRRAGVERLIDIRRSNSSQLAGFTKREDLAYFLRELCGAAYVHEPLLAPTQELLDRYRSHRVTWQEYELEFLHLMRQRRVEDRLDRESLAARSMLLCSEPTAERCHRRLVAEYLARHWGDLAVTHL